MTRSRRPAVVDHAVRIVQRARDHVLGSRYTHDGADYCHEVSIVAWQELRRQRIHAAIVQGAYRTRRTGLAGHTWIECAGYVVDGTATQFGIRPRVYVAKIANARRYDRNNVRWLPTAVSDIEAPWWRTGENGVDAYAIVRSATPNRL